MINSILIGEKGRVYVHSWTVCLSFCLLKCVITEACISVGGQVQAAALWTGLGTVEVLILAKAPPCASLEQTSSACLLAPPSHVPRSSVWK